MSRPPRRRATPALLRARYRTLFFLLLLGVTLAIGERTGAIAAASGALIAACSLRAAHRHPTRHGHAFVALDWMVLGVVLALCGGTGSWLLLTVPPLVVGELAGAPRGAWPHLVGPSLLLAPVLALADPTSQRGVVLRLAEVAVLVAIGCLVATLLHPRRIATRKDRTGGHKVDVTTGLSTAACLPAFLDAGARVALLEHRPLSVVYARLEHYQDSRDFLGHDGSEELMRGVARRAGRHAGRDGRVFRVRPDALVLVLPGLSLAEARDTAAELARDVAAGLIAGRRQTLATGVSSFPTLRDTRALVTTARDEATPDATPVAVAGTVLPLAAAR